MEPGRGKGNEVLGLFISAVAILLMLATTTPAYAYLDPGTASMVLQVLLGGAAGALVVGKLYWSKLKGFFLRRPVEAAVSDDAKPDE